MMIAKVIDLLTSWIESKVLMLNNGKTMMMIAGSVMVMIGYHCLIAGRVMIMIARLMVQAMMKMCE